MNAITVQEYTADYGAPEVTTAEFDRLAKRALTVTHALCFGREERNETAAKAAMKEMLALWLARGGEAGLFRERTLNSETAGNYSATYGQPEQTSVGGLPVAATALMILTDAGLRDPAV